MSRLQDIIGVLRGAQIVLNALFKHNNDVCKHLWTNSSVKEVIDNNINTAKEYAEKVYKEPSKEFQNVQNIIKESVDRTLVVADGFKYLVLSRNDKGKFSFSGRDVPRRGSHSKQDVANVDISSITLKELEEIVEKRNREKEKRRKITASSSERIEPLRPSIVNAEPVAKTSLAKPDVEEPFVNNIMKMISQTPRESTQSASLTDAAKIQLESSTELSKLGDVARQRKVPSSRVGRMASFGTLFAGLGLGTVTELTKGALGLGGAHNVREAFLSPANAERIVDTLCKVRGAALKLGQILSIQDANIVPPELAKAFERVRQAADYMPNWQVEKVMITELGHDWRKKLREFDSKPFAAASIGQVHRGVIDDGMTVAIKIQYPGVARSIESDIDNLISLLKVWDVFPRGFFIDNLVKVAKRELAWEVDYLREAEYTEKYGKIFAGYNEYYVPKVISNMTTASVLTTELVPGLPLDKCLHFPYNDRKFIAESTLKLCLRELFQFQCMQTDPNWSNFLYDPVSKRLMLIDFGSTRFYTREFMRNYKEVITAAVKDDSQKILDISRKMGFLTGYETKQMEEAHVNAVMILGEVFRYEGEFDFGKQSTTKRIAQLVPTMIAHRLCPPPEEIYSIHRKLSGIFLLCARLDVKLACRPLFNDIVANSIV